LLGINNTVEEYAKKVLKINIENEDDIMRCPSITTHYTELGKYVSAVAARKDKPLVITTQSLEMIDVFLESDLDFEVVTVRKCDNEIKSRTLTKEEVLKNREAFDFDPRL
jgi:hypothetical protein